MSFTDDIILDAMVHNSTVHESRSSALLSASDAIRTSLFPHQRAVFQDPSRRKAVLCPRRAGKSWTAMSYAFDVCLRQDYAQVVICLLTLKHAKNVYWRQMHRFAKAYGLDLHWHIQDMTVTFPNGSTILMIGCESLQEVDKLRGGSYDLVIIDECKSFNPQILAELLDDVIDPALDDRLGTVMMIGTPGNVLSGPFYWATAPYYEVTTPEGIKRPFSRTYYAPEEFWANNPDEVYWSKHTWTRADNTSIPHLWKASLEKKRSAGWTDGHPTWRREHLGEWVPALGSYVYRLQELVGDPVMEARVRWTPDPRDAVRHGLPDGHQWRFICGLDLGFEDDFAMVVAAWSPTDGTLWHVFDWKANHLDFFQIATEIGNIIKRFGAIDAIVADTGGSGGKTVIETLNRHYGFNIQPAEKREKFDYIEILNGELLRGGVRILRNSNLDLELRTLQWLMDEHDDKSLLSRTGKLKENPSQPNHLCDALLYLWRYSYHHWSQEVVNKPAPGTREWQIAYDHEAMTKLARARDEQAQAGAWLTGSGLLYGLN